MAAPLAKQPTCTVAQIDAGDFVESGLNRDDVKSLRDFLSNLGYQSAEGQSVVASVTCEGSKHQATVTLLPFTQDGTTLAAHIAFWNGKWNSKNVKGAIAVVEGDPGLVYSYRGKKGVVAQSQEDWSKQAKIPFESIQGFQLPMTVEVETSETVDAQPQLPSTDSAVRPLGATYCKTVRAARIGYTLLGFVAYKFWQQKYFCYNGTSAVSNVNVSAYVSNMDPEHYYRGVVSQWDIPLSTGAHDSMRQGQIDNCILKYGCIGTYYPTVQIIAYKDGSWYYTTWQ